MLCDVAMINFLLNILGLGSSSRPTSRVHTDPSFGELTAGTIYRLLRPQRWAM